MENILGVGSITEPYGIIYKVENRINGKIYIGQTIKSLDIRKSGHYAGAKVESKDSYFSRALRKYPPSNLTWSIIDSAKNKGDLNNKEIFWISHFDSNNPIKGYNLTEGGEGTVGYKHTEETKELLSNLQTGRKHTEEWKKTHSREMEGVNNPRTRLSKDDVIYIKKRLVKGDTVKKISEDTGVTTYVISRINRGKTFIEIEVEGFKPSKGNTRDKYLNRDSFENLIRDLITYEYTYEYLSKKYGIPKYTIAQVKKGTSYKNFEIPRDIIKEVEILRNNKYTLRRDSNG